MRPSIPLAVLAVSLSAGAPTAYALTFEVGPGKTIANVGDVPWESLNPGDTVLIYYRATPYKEKFVLSRQGTPSAPITVRGVLGPLGERPILDGNGATTRPQLDYYSRSRGVIKIGGSTVPFADGLTVMPQWLTIENLDIRSARPPYSFTGPSGVVESYPNNASTIYLEFGENITVRNCALHDSGHGFFANSFVSDRTDKTRLFRLSTNDEACDARNNVAYVTASGDNLVVLDNTGRLTLTRNWFKTGWTRSSVNRPKGTITDNGNLTGASPGFVSEAGQDYHLAAGSACIDTGTSLNAAVLPDNDVVREYVKHQSSVARAVHGALDIGAYEF
jgi:hypothetical protein